MKFAAIALTSSLLLFGQSRPLDEHFARETTDVRIKTFEKLLLVRPMISSCRAD